MEAFAQATGLLPEQLCDAPDVPARGVVLGQPSGSAMPLVWAHAEYVKLLRSLRDGRVFDTPAQTVGRYLVERTASRLTGWPARRAGTAHRGAGPRGGPLDPRRALTPSRSAV